MGIKKIKHEKELLHEPFGLDLPILKNVAQANLTRMIMQTSR